MKIQDILLILENYWFKNEPTNSFAEIDKIEEYIGAPLPADYKYFLQWFSNGGESDHPLDYLMLFKDEEVLSRQMEYEISKWASNLLVIGLEGDDIFCFDITNKLVSSNYRVLKLSVSSRDITEAEIVAEDFADFICRLIRPVMG